MNIKQFFAYGKPWYKKWWVYVLGILLIASALAPYILDMAARINPYSLSFEKKDLLQFWGSYLAFIGTVALGALALWQNNKANDINNRLLKLEEYKLSPMVDIEICSEKAKNKYTMTKHMTFLNSLDDNEHLFIIKNISDAYINDIQLVLLVVKQNNTNDINTIVKLENVENQWINYLPPRKSNILNLRYNDEGFEFYKVSDELMTDYRIYELTFELRRIDGKIFIEKINFQFAKNVLDYKTTVETIVNKDFDIKPKEDNTNE